MPTTDRNRYVRVIVVSDYGRAWFWVYHDSGNIFFCGFGDFRDRESRFLYASVNAQRSGDHTMVVDGDGRVVFDG